MLLSLLESDGAEAAAVAVGDGVVVVVLVWWGWGAEMCRARLICEWITWIMWDLDKFGEASSAAFSVDSCSTNQN